MNETRSVQALQGLLDISKAMGSEVELNALLEVIVKRASLIMEADRTTVFVFDPKTQRLWSRVGEGLEAGTIELDLGSGIAGDVARTKQLENITDASKELRFNPEFDRRHNYTTRSILCAPILNGGGNLLGVMQTINKRNRAHFDEEDERVMSALASHVAVALERANLTEAFVERNRFEESLKVASEIQLGMLPKTALDVPADSPFEIAALVRPARHVGGDFYDHRQNHDGKLFFCIGDVSGKGVPAALMMAVSRTLFRANSSIIPNTDDIMAAVNEVLCEETAPSMFVTAFCAILDVKTGELQFCNAGHNPPILIRGEGDPREISIDPGLVLGVTPRYKYRSEKTTLRPGDLLYLYTDGISDQTNPAGEMFGLPRITKFLTTVPRERASGIIDATLAAVDRFSTGAPQFDDLTVLCVRFRGSIGDRETDRHHMESSFVRRMESLDEVFDFAEKFFAANGLDGATRYAIGVAIEEVFTNMVKYNPHGQGELAVRLDRDNDRAIIGLTDFDSEPFDINKARDVDIQAPLSVRNPGGLGIHLVRKLMDEVNYAYHDRQSTITLVKNLVTGLTSSAKATES